MVVICGVVVMLHRIVDLMRIESETESVARMVMVVLHHRERSRSLIAGKKKIS